MRLCIATLLIAAVGLSACATNNGTGIQAYNSRQPGPNSPPLSEAVKVGPTLYLSGQLGFVPGAGKLAPGGIREETRQTMENIKRSLEAQGYAMADVVKCTVMLADIAEWGAFNEVYRTFFQAPYPARSVFGVGGLVAGARVEVECMASK